MQGFDMIAADLRRLCGGSSGERLADEDVERWSHSLCTDRGALYDEIAIYLARGFHKGDLDFDYCDAVVNAIHGVIIDADECRPELFWETYLAFDEGEYYHGNNREEDPVEVYTKPEIARIVAKNDCV